MRHDLTTVDFHGATLIAVRGETPAATLVAMKPVVEGMRLDWSAQRRKLTDHPMLGTCMVLMTIQMPGDNQAREWAFLPLSRLSFWLATIQPSRVTDPDTKAKVIAYQTECADVLFAHFFGKTTASVATSHAQKLAMIREARLSGFTKPELQEMWVELGLPATEGMRTRVLRRQGDLFDSRPLGQA